MTQIEEKVLLQAQIDNLYRYIMIIGFIFFGWMSYLTSSALYQKPFELIAVIIFFVFIGFALWSLMGFWIYFDNIKIFSDRLEATNFWGLYKKTIYFTDIFDVKNQHKAGEYNSWDELVIRYGTQNKYKIYSTSYKNYHQLKNILTKKRGKNLKISPDEAPKSKMIENGIIVSILIFCLWGILYFYNQSNDYKLNKDELVSIELTLEKKPLIITGNKGSKSLEMNIREYPDFRFDISGTAYNATQTSSLIENTEGGSRLILTIDKQDYLQKLVQSKEATFWTKHFNFRNISIYEIKDDKQTYLSTSNYEEENRGDYTWGYLGIIGLLMYIGYVSWEEQKNKNKKNPQRKRY